ncbi:phytanoyl-CoA dioxygenase family protein [Streptomyces sp. NBC_00847]|uniref:phytanoyl-CoA dioxygenase family protein n=1 Tax=unclassified Streptomyces TaxID=2593676 RepID=UPI00225B4C43|nr:phytanoyl-CoA dioxygenase family protein [Streptomyces sp. NBC_00847]MCX4879258.1 phytanoyl-CoA dioxygenase family protein [Streptomyces sp. NBC_00847]
MGCSWRGRACSRPPPTSFRGSRGSTPSPRDQARPNALGTRDIIFTGHSDAHHGFTQGWHKDSGSTALGDPLAGYLGEPSTSLFRRRPEVVKIGIYLQESTDLNCLRVDPGSHLRPGLQPLRPTRVLMDAGDLVVFDVRITHAGAVVPDEDSTDLDALRERMSAFVTFGLDSPRTRAFARANMVRQKGQVGLGQDSAVGSASGKVRMVVTWLPGRSGRCRWRPRAAGSRRRW